MHFPLSFYFLFGFNPGMVQAMVELNIIAYHHLMHVDVTGVIPQCPKRHFAPTIRYCQATGTSLNHGFSSLV
jgi:hypothetical protein